ncbi:hypothetical protein [Aquiflexum sp.]
MKDEGRWCVIAPACLWQEEHLGYFDILNSPSCDVAISLDEGGRMKE